MPRLPRKRTQKTRGSRTAGRPKSSSLLMVLRFLAAAVLSIGSIRDDRPLWRWPRSVLVAADAPGTDAPTGATTEDPTSQQQQQQQQQNRHSLALSDGHSMPRVGLGVALTGERTYEAVTHAIQTVGYRLVDTAAEESYGNEDQVGRAVRDYYNSDSNERDGGNDNNKTADRIFVTTKLWDTDHGFYNTLRAFLESYRELNKFSTSSTSGDENIPIDLYLVHSPYGGRLLETWDALLYLKEHHGDKVVSIGVSNFGTEHLEVLRKAGRPMPVVNQIEMHPLVFRQREDLLAYCSEHEIKVQAFGSLMHGYPRFLADPPQFLSEMVERYNHNSNHNSKVTVAHVLLQWALHHGFAVIPKSSRPERITENVRYIDLGPSEGRTGRSAEGSEKNPHERLVLSEADVEILDHWGDNLPYSYRNIYKFDWNWNPIDEAPAHAGIGDYWPGYERLGGAFDMHNIPEGLLEEEWWGGDEDEDDDEGYGDGDDDHDHDDDAFDEDDEEDEYQADGLGEEL